MSKLKLAVIAVLLITCLSCTNKTAQNSALQGPNSQSQTAQPRHSVDVVKASVEETTIAANTDGDAIVQLNIDKGYHVNANPPTFPYLKATELEISPTAGISVSFIVYPDPLTKTFPFADKPLAVYEGVTNIKVRLKVDKSMKPGAHNLSAKLQVQACDDQVCYAPGTLSLTIPLIVK